MAKLRLRKVGFLIRRHTTRKQDSIPDLSEWKSLSPNHPDSYCAGARIPANYYSGDLGFYLPLYPHEEYSSTKKWMAYLVILGPPNYTTQHPEMSVSILVFASLPWSCWARGWLVGGQTAQGPLARESVMKTQFKKFGEIKEVLIKSPQEIKYLPCSWEWIFAVL